MHVQVDVDGHAMQMLHAIVDYRKNINIVKKSDVCLREKRG